MNAMPSATSFSREVLAPQTNGSGFSINAFRFQQTLTAVCGTFPTGTTAAWPAVGSSGSGGYGIAVVQQDPAISSMINNYLDTRTVAVSARIQCTMPALTAQGFVHIAVVPEDMQGSTAWQYPTTFSGMERAPFYQKVPLSNLINNSMTVALPIMDEGAWRYRNTQVVPSQVGQAFLALNATPTGNVQVTQVGSGTTLASGLLNVAYAFPFASVPVVVGTVTSVSSQDVSLQVNGLSTTGFSAETTTDTGGSAAIAQSAIPFDWEATGTMTQANAALYYAAVGQQVPLTAGAYVQQSIPGIETSYGWGVLIVATENVGTANNISPYEIEIIRHYEAIPNDATGNIITGTKAAPNCPEVLTLNKAVQDEAGPITNLPDTGLDVKIEGGFVNTVQKCASWVSGVSGSLAGFHPALGVVSAVTGAIGGVKRRRSY